MKILFNPESGATIHDFIVSGKLLDPHSTGELKRYEDSEAEALLNTYEFLQELEPEHAKRIIGKSPKPNESEIKCGVCDKTFQHRLGLSGHQRSHKGVDFTKLPETIAEFDLSDIPVAEGKKVFSQQETKEIVDQYEQTGDINNGLDKDGVDWYGEGLTEDRGSLSKVVPLGQRGHFGA